MDIRNCRNCKRLFNYVSGPMICQDCKDSMEKRFYDVKEYIRENPKCNIQEVSSAMGVSQHQIRQWVREERLQFAEDSNIALQCEKCGAKIYTGRYCDNCKAKIANRLSSALASNPLPQTDKSSGGMRFKKG